MGLFCELSDTIAFPKTCGFASFGTLIKGGYAFDKVPILSTTIAGGDRPVEAKIMNRMKERSSEEIQELKCLSAQFRWAVDELKRQTREGVPIGDILRLCKWVMLPPRQRFLEILESMGDHSLDRSRR